jgi:hypothetical protein
MEITPEDKKRAYQKKYREEHKEASKEYQQRHKDRLNSRKRELYNQNISGVRDKKKIYNKENSENLKERSKKYRIENADILKAKRLIKNRKNAESINLRNKKYQEDHPEYFKKYRKKYWAENKEILGPKNKKYREDHKEEITIGKRSYHRNKIKTDPIYRIQKNLRRRLNLALKSQGAKKDVTTLKLCGESWNFVWSHLESQFKEGMTRENYGSRGWTIDHIKPVASFNLNDPEEQKKCNHYTNLQPLWWWENLSKGNKILDNVDK